MCINAPRRLADAAEFYERGSMVSAQWVAHNVTPQQLLLVSEQAEYDESCT